MKKQKKQSFLTAIIFILVITLVMLVGSIIYEEIINMKKQPTQNVSGSLTDNNNENKEEQEDKTDDNTEIKDEEQEKEKIQEEPKQEENEDVRQEETNTEDTSKNKEDRAISLAKQEWGEDDSVTFSVEKKKDSIYYVAVKSGGAVLSWYEVDTETWEISEY